MELQLVRCPRCRTPLMDGMYQGVGRFTCRNRRCRRRVWVGGDGKKLIVIQIDKGPRQVE